MSEEENNQDQKDENKLIALRREKLTDIREQGNAFPNNFIRNSLAKDLQNQYSEKSKEELAELNQHASVAGRVMAKRGPFLVLQDMSGRIQAYIDRKGLDKEQIKEIDTWDIGDIIGVSGPVSKSGKGDLYVKMEAVSLLTKSLRPLPEKFHGLTDQEQRYRMRYVDLIMNQEARETFKLRSKIVAFIRNYLSEKDFLEVELREKIENLWQHAQDCVQKKLLPVINHDAPALDWEVKPIDLYSWATISRIEMPDEFSLLMTFVSQTIKPVSSNGELLQNDNPKDVMYQKHREIVLGAAVSLLMNASDLCKNKKGRIVVDNITKNIMENERQWFGEDKPSLSQSSMSDLINEYLKLTKPTV